MSGEVLVGEGWMGARGGTSLIMEKPIRSLTELQGSMLPARRGRAGEDQGRRTSRHMYTCDSPPRGLPPSPPHTPAGRKKYLVHKHRATGEERGRESTTFATCLDSASSTDKIKISHKMTHTTAPCAIRLDQGAIFSPFPHHREEAGTIVLVLCVAHPTSRA